MEQNLLNAIAEADKVAQVANDQLAATQAKINEAIKACGDIHPDLTDLQRSMAEMPRISEQATKTQARINAAIKASSEIHLNFNA